MEAFAIVIIFIGCLFGGVAALVRLTLRLPTSSPWYKILVEIFSTIDLRKKDKDSFLFCVQIAGIVWVFSGISYNILVNLLTLSPFEEDILAFIVCFGPGFFLAGLLNFLRKKYWSVDDY